MNEMDGKTSKTNIDAVDMDVVSDALKKPKRVMRSSTGRDSVEPLAREDDLTEEIDISSADPGMRPWKPMSGYRGQFTMVNSTNQGWHPNLSSFSSNFIENGSVIAVQKRAQNKNARNEVIIYPDEGSSFPFQRSDKRFKGKEVENKGNHRQNFPVLRPSLSNRSMTRQPNGIASFSNKDKEFYSYLDSGLKSRTERNEIFCFSDPEVKVAEVLPSPSYLSSSGINTGRAKAILEENVEKNGYVDLSEGFSSNELNFNRLHSDKKKGKLILEGGTSNEMQHGKPTFRSSRNEINSALHPSRAASFFEKDLVIISEEEDSFESHQNLGWRKAHNFKMNQFSHACPRNDEKKQYSSYLSELRQESDIKDKDHDQAFPEPVGSRRNHSWKKHVKGEKKCSSLLSNSGETSGSILNQPSIPQLHAGTSDLKQEKSDKNRSHGTIIDFPEESCCNSHGRQRVSDNSSANQIESDETFARKLQEQFYHETVRFINTEKVDETIAWSLQQDEDAKAAAIPCRGHSNSVLFDEIRSNFNSEADLERRLDFLEAMEDALENNELDYDDITSNDSFNDTDYEMQFNHDENDLQHVGYSEINNLPLSLIQNDNNKEACAVCLEIPSVGETVRHLPCLHKFHKMCIDVWLRRKPSCPVCKLNIT